MWLIGHTASAYLIVKGIWIAQRLHLRTKSQIKKVRNERMANSKIYHFPPHFLLLLFVFANWPDFVHVGELRVLSHNMIAVITVPSIILLILTHRQVVNRFEAILLLCASVVHMLTDIIFSSFYPFYPFQTKIFIIYSFNSYEHIVVESLISAIFLGVFIWSKDWKELAHFLSSNLIKSQGEEESNLSLEWNRYFYPFIFLLFSLFSLIQLLMYFNLFFSSYLTANLFYTLFLILFIGFIAILGMIFLTFTISAQKKYLKVSLRE
jgi:hypothetical protein